VKRAWKWTLPFFGKAEYVPELNLWFGLSPCRPFHLCAADLSALDLQRPPRVQHTWVDLDMPKNWEPLQLDLVNLGSGRFCIIKTFLGWKWQPVRLVGCWWLVLIFSERKVLLAGCWWLVRSERKVLLSGG
jgi:hypothetical protein